MRRLVFLVPFLFTACATDDGSNDPDDDGSNDPDNDALAVVDDPSTSVAVGPAAWVVAPTLHVGAKVLDRASANSRRVFPVWIAGRANAPVTFDVTATATGNHDVRVTVLGPLVHGTRATLGAGGYGSPRGNVEISIDATRAGEYLIVVGSYQLAHETFYDLEVHCDDCDSDRVDVLAEPKAGALVATGSGIVQARLGAVLAQRSFDVQMQVWASTPGHPEGRRLVATSTASGNQVNALVPASVRPGDDLTLVIKQAGGLVLDTGVLTRYAPQAVAIARTDSVVYGDLVSVQISGVVGYFEGVAAMSLRSEQRHLEIAMDTLHATQPGSIGNGFGAFDATFNPPLTDANGLVNPSLPHNGERLSIGDIGGDGNYHRAGCFEYCNDLSGMATCTGGTRTCPTTPW